MSQDHPLDGCRTASTDGNMPRSHNTGSHKTESGKPAFPILHCAFTKQVSEQADTAGWHCSIAPGAHMPPSIVRRQAGLTAVHQAELEHAQQLRDQACWGRALGQCQLGC